MAIKLIKTKSPHELYLAYGGYKKWEELSPTVQASWTNAFNKNPNCQVMVPDTVPNWDHEFDGVHKGWAEYIKKKAKPPQQIRFINRPS